MQNELGKRIRELRNKKGYSLRKLAEAEKVRLHFAYLNQVETKNEVPSEEKIRAILTELDCIDEADALMLSAKKIPQRIKDDLFYKPKKGKVIKIIL